MDSEINGIISVRQLLEAGAELSLTVRTKGRNNKKNRGQMASGAEHGGDRVANPVPLPSFVSSDGMLQSIFDAIDQKIFNCNLDGIKMEWCDKLKSRAAVTYEKTSYSSKQIFIRCSKLWFKHRTRKQLVEAILYEMIQLYIDINDYYGEKKENPDLDVYLLAAAIEYFNRRFKTNLILNNNHKRDADNDSDVTEMLASIAKDSKISQKIPTYDSYKMASDIQVLTNKVIGNKDAVKCGQSCGGFCYTSGCSSAVALRHRYIGSNIYFIFELDGPKCFLCDEEITQGGLNNHFDQICPVFKPPSNPAA
ncbi:uncharacterized protein LOC129574707 [Sitodiplosis mosellana]|uniref:uncharacterized protein LOC129574707 n=1 Tax=Sitodiplosis mosellana TaxID=263140 RepID=UPI0024439420|nr:uncharacterized protein LOC129574707 [Sitodiplosis mosellana]